MLASSLTLDPAEERRGFPLQDYAALGDGRSLALVGPDGSVAWWCVPNLDSVPLFDTLLDPAAGGYFSVQPAEPFRAERRYREDSNVLETLFTCASGTVRLTEALNSTLAGRLPWCELARRIEVMSGTVKIRVRVVFGTRGDAVSPWLQPNLNGCIFHVGPVLGLFRTTPNLALIREEDRMILAEGTLSAGERALVAIVAGENEPLGVPPLSDMDERIDLSDEAWRAWARGLRYDGPYRDAVRRSGLALKLLLFSPSGAIAAAGTTSLPERICWSERKQAYTFYPGTERLDASLVLAARFGFAAKHRVSATCDAIRRELGVGLALRSGGPWIYRYSGAEQEEGAFLACTFWLAEAYAELGRQAEAEALMGEALAALPPGIGILAEMIDPESGHLLGNLPQGLSHLALIHAAISLDGGLRRERAA
ncbi:MAG: glycoside hydrolase family 15 protein [Janthinobacterium lividum]